MTSLIQTLTVAEYLNFHHAANVLGTSQSCVSARIKALEETLGILLFERRPRGVRLTEAGCRFVAEVAAGIGHLDNAVRTAGTASSGATGQIAIGLNSSIAGGSLAALRSRFRDAYPDVEQIVMEGTSAQTIALVRDGKLDLALVLEPVEAPDCHSRPLWAEPFLIAVPVAHALALADAVSWSDLATESFLISNAGGGPQLFEHVVRRMAERGHSPHVRRCDVSRDTLMHMIASSDGVTLTSDAARHTPWPGVAFRPIHDETEQARFSAIWSPNNRSPALLNLLDIAAELEKKKSFLPSSHIDFTAPILPPA
ncbi:LysR family transcriptional regulator [Sphingomonas sp. Leaf10]|uniref:LysR family transcriptional regulator n=1 Tax=Sphingomonas sp. Leaf10 TaxID=1735676 RepID=UPI0006F5562A|nr:LysR family transcriptional regulator [Sphingomonas sp. Leaf10]KQM38803.1 LysR family transcriptional regulator [Sphingomonas sp. Leaf10]